MAALILPHRLRTIPDTPVQIDPGSPFAVGLLDAYVAWQPRSLILAIPAAAANLTRYGVGIGGRGALATGASSQISYYDARGNPSGDFTFLGFFTALPSASLGFSTLTGVSGFSGAAGGAGFVATGGNVPRLRAYNTSNSDVTGSGTYAIGGLNAEVGRVKAAAKLGAIWVNGTQRAADTSIPNYVQPSGQGFTFGRNGGAASAVVYHFGLLWNWALPDAMCAEISANPLQILRPAQRRIWVPAAAGASGSVGLATETDTAQALAATQVRAVGLATETDAALALSRVSITAVGTASETDAALALTAAGPLPVGLAQETDQALALLPGVTVYPGFDGAGWRTSPHGRRKRREDEEDEPQQRSATPEPRELLPALAVVHAPPRVASALVDIVAQHVEASRRTAEMVQQIQRAATATAAQVRYLEDVMAHQVAAAEQEEQDIEAITMLLAAVLD